MLLAAELCSFTPTVSCLFLPLAQQQAAGSASRKPHFAFGFGRLGRMKSEVRC